MKQPFFLERQKPGSYQRAEPRMQHSQGAASSQGQHSIFLPNPATPLHCPPAQAGLKRRARSGMCQLKSFKYRLVVVAVGGLSRKGSERWKINWRCRLAFTSANWRCLKISLWNASPRGHLSHPNIEAWNRGDESSTEEIYFTPLTVKEA